MTGVQTCALPIFALTLRVSPLMRLFRHQQSSFIDVTIALINNIVTIIIIIVIVYIYILYTIKRKH